MQRLGCWRLNSIDLPEIPIVVSTVTACNTDLMAWMLGDGLQSSMSGEVSRNQLENVQLRIRHVQVSGQEPIVLKGNLPAKLT